MSIQLPTLERLDARDYGLEPQLPEVFDASMVKDYLWCPSMFYLRHVLGLEPTLKKPEPHFPWGTRWHSVMFTWNSLPPETDLERRIDACLDTIRIDWPDELNDLDPKNRTMGRMVDLFAKWVKRFGLRDLKDWVIIRAEQYFEIEDEDGFRWCGRLDGLKRRLRDAQLFITDYKTTSYKRDTIFSELKYGIQIPGYVWAGQHLHGQPLAGGILDILYATKTKDDLLRREMKFGQVLLAEWRDNTWRICDEIRANFEKYPYDIEGWVKNRENCYRMWGCKYTDVHEPVAIDDTRLLILSENFTLKRWDPNFIAD